METSQRRDSTPPQISDEKAHLDKDFGSEFDNVRRSAMFVDVGHLLSQTPKKSIPLTRVADEYLASSPTKAETENDNTLFLSPLQEEPKKKPIFLPLLRRGIDDVPRSISNETSPKPETTVKSPSAPSNRLPQLIRIVSDEPKPTINNSKATLLDIPTTRLPTLIPINKSPKRASSLSVNSVELGTLKRIKLVKLDSPSSVDDVIEVSSEDEDDVFFDATDGIEDEGQSDADISQEQNEIVLLSDKDRLNSASSDDLSEIEVYEVLDNLALHPRIRKVNIDGEVELVNDEDDNETPKGNPSGDGNNNEDDRDLNREEDNEDNDEDEGEGDEEIIKNEETNEAEVSNIKNKLYQKLTGFSNEGPYGLDTKIDELYKILAETAIKKDKNSCFIFGPKSSGKTAALNKALQRVKSEIGSSDDIIQIKLNGMVQNEDKLAVRAIAEQLDSEISRIYDVDLEDLERSEFLSRKSLSLTMSNVLTILDTEVSLHDGTSSKIENPIIFIIDDVDVYAKQGRQTLLYNLFDLVENSRTPICVLCFSSNFTLKDLLEKRVRSRFSQKSIQFQKLDRDEFIDVAKQIIQIDTPTNQLEKDFNSNVDELVSKPQSVLRKLIVFNHLTTANLKEFQNHCIYAVSKLSVNQPFFNDIDFEKYTKNLSKGSLRQIINSLSDLETFLLVSAARVIAKNDLNWCNLNLVYEEYENQVKARGKEGTSSTGGFGAVASTGYKIWSKNSCKHPWETLQSIGLLTTPTQINGASRANDFSNNKLETKMWHVELTLEELRLVIDVDKPVKSWTRL